MYTVYSCANQQMQRTCFLKIWYPCRGDASGLRLPAPSKKPGKSLHPMWMSAADDPSPPCQTMRFMAARAWRNVSLGLLWYLEICRYFIKSEKLFMPFLSNLRNCQICAPFCSETGRPPHSWPLCGWGPSRRFGAGKLFTSRIIPLSNWLATGLIIHSIHIYIYNMYNMYICIYIMG